MPSPASSASSSPDPRDPEAFSDLVREHHRELLAYALALAKDPVTAREIVQDTFVVAYEKIAAFDPARDFAAWLRGILRNKWREWLRKHSRPEVPESEIALMDLALSRWQDRRVSRDHRLFDALEQCLRRLPPNLRGAVDACYYRGETSEEAALSLGIAPAAVRKRLQRARDMLRDCMEKIGGLPSQNPAGPSISTEPEDAG